MAKVGTIPCLVCGEPFEFLTTSHMGVHPPGYPQTDPKYKEWVAERYNVKEEDVPLSPSEWRERKQHYDEWRENTVVG